MKKHKGKTQPAETINKMVKVKFAADGHVTVPIPACDCDWDHKHDPISHYEVID